jgi:hypothetical protein
MLCGVETQIDNAADLFMRLVRQMLKCDANLKAYGNKFKRIYWHME